MTLTAVLQFVDTPDGPFAILAADETDPGRVAARCAGAPPTKCAFFPVAFG